MYRTLSQVLKNAKNTRALPSISKVTGNLFRSNLETVSRSGSFVATTSRSFNSGEHRFEKIAERGSSMRQGKLNIKTTLNMEPLNTVMNFIQDNVNSMNEGDYLDAIFLISNKLENDHSGRYNNLLTERNQGFQLVKKYIETHFEKMATENFASQILLLLASQLAAKNKLRSVFEQTQIDKLVTNVLQNLESNSSKMTLQTILNVISLIGMFRNINPVPYLKERNEDLPNLGYGNMYRILRRISSPKENESVREYLSKFLVKDFLNTCAGEKMINRARAFNVVARLEWMSAYSTNHFNLVNLLKDIRSQAENHDQQSILQMVEGLGYFEDFSKSETLKEFYDIVTMTIKHQPENVKVDFVLRFVEQIAKYKNDNALTTEHIKTIIDYATSSIVSLSESNLRIPNFNIIIPIFLLMKKHKYYDKEPTEKLYKILEPNIHKLSVEDSLIAFKIIISKVLGEEYILKLESIVPEAISKDLLVYNNLPITRFINSFHRAVFFGAKSPVTQEIFNNLLNKIDAAFATSDPNYLLTFVESYTRELQDNIISSFKIPILERIINKFDTRDVGTFKNPARALAALNELMVPRERNDLYQKLSDLVKFISEDERLKKSALNYFMRLSKESKSGISNASVYKFLNLIKEYSKNEEYLRENERIISKLLTISFNFLFNMESDSSITNEAISSITQLADFLLKKHPNLSIDNASIKAPHFLKAFNQAHINSTALNRALFEFLKNFKNFDKLLSVNVITILEKLNRSDISQEEFSPILAKFLPTSEKADENFNQLNDSKKIGLFKLYSSLNIKHNKLITDQMMKKYKNYLIENCIKQSDNENLRMQSLISLSFVKNNLLNYNQDFKEINILIRNVFQNSHTKKIFRYLESISNPNKGKFTLRLFSEFCQQFEKENSVDKFFLLKVLDKLTTIKWSSPSFYNKIITEYEKNYSNFRVVDHAELIEYFARVELNKEDVLKASIKNINTRILSEFDRFTLFNSLVKLGFTNEEWRESILQKLVTESDFNHTLSKCGMKDKFQFLINLWKLEYENWPANRSDILESAIQTINKFNKLKISDKNIRYNISIAEDWLSIIRRAPFFDKFDPDLKANLETMYKYKVERDETTFTLKLVQEYLKVMGHANVEFQPSETLCDFYLPETKTAIVYLKKNIQCIGSNELNQTGLFIVNVLKSQGLEPAIINFSINEYINKDSEEEVVSYLESLNIPNKVKDGSYNFDSIQTFKKSFKDRRVVKPSPDEANVSDDE